MRNIFKNLGSYSDSGLMVIPGNSATYFADRSFRPSAIIGAAFGAGMGEMSYNEVLSQSIPDARNFYQDDLTAVVQAEIGSTPSGEKIPNLHKVGESELYAEGEQGLAVSKIDTSGVMVQAKAMLDQYGLNPEKALFIAHPAHVQRVMWRAEDNGITGRPFIRRDIVWPTNDSQLWVRSPWFFNPRELVGRVLGK